MTETITTEEAEALRRRLDAVDLGGDPNKVPRAHPHAGLPTVPPPAPGTFAALQMLRQEEKQQERFRVAAEAEARAAAEREAEQAREEARQRAEREAAAQIREAARVELEALGPRIAECAEAYGAVDRQYAKLDDRWGDFREHVKLLRRRLS